MAGRDGLSTAFLPAGTDQNQPHRHQHTIIGDANLESGAAVQLIAKTTTLVISGLESGAGEPLTRVSSYGVSTPHLAETILPQASSSSVLAEPCLATSNGHREDASETFSGIAPTVMPPANPRSMSEGGFGSDTPNEQVGAGCIGAEVSEQSLQRQLLDLPNEVLLQILGYLDVCDLLATSRTCHHLRTLSVAPYLHHLRLRRTRALLPPLLTSPARPSLADLIRRSIFLTHTTFASRRLARNLAAIRLARQLATRPSAEALVARCVLPPECLPSAAVPVAPALVARKRAVEKEKVKDGLRAWVGSVWKGEVRQREEGVRKWEERAGVGRVWRLRRFWERVGRGET